MKSEQEIRERIEILKQFHFSGSELGEEMKDTLIWHLEWVLDEVNTQDRKETKTILDACCGSRMFHFNKHNPNVLYMDNRQFEDTLCDGRKLIVNPDIVADFKEMPFEDNLFHLVIFDPPHLLDVGEKSWMYKKYGKLTKGWPEEIKKGFDECMRVLKPNGTLIFKWATRDITFKQILECIKTEPIIYHKNNNTYFLVFCKHNNKGDTTDGN